MKKALPVIIRIILCLLSGAAAVISFGLCVVTSSDMYLLTGIVAVLCTVSGIVMKRKWQIPYIVGMVLILMYGGFTGSFSSDKAFQYPYQRWYVHERGGFDVRFFPEQLPDTVYSYSTVFQPSIMQGSGFYSVLVETDAETVAEIKETAEKKAVEKALVTDVIDEYEAEYSMSHDSGTFQYISTGTGEQGYFVYIPYEVLKNPEGYCIYTEYTDYDFNHPDTHAYIINETTNTIIWSLI